MEEVLTVGVVMEMFLQACFAGVFVSGFVSFLGLGVKSMRRLFGS